MKIAFDYQIFSWQPYGGISRYFALLAGNLREMNHDVAIFSPFYCNNYLDRLPAGCIHGKKRNPPSFVAGHGLWVLNQLISEKKIGKWAPDIIHETYYFSLKRSKGKIPVVLTVYDMIHEIFADSFWALDRTSNWKKKAVERADHIIAISHNTKKDLVNLFGVPEEKVSVVHLGVDLCGANGGPEQSLALDRPYVLHVGGRAKYKNFISLLEAVSLSKEIMNNFYIVAFGGGRLSKKEEETISRLGYEDGQVRQVSGGDEEISLYYKNATALVYPSKYEGFGLPPLEAMACGCPVISSNSSSLPEVVGDVGVYFDPDDIEGIKSAIESVVFSPEKMKIMSKLGRERAKLFTWHKCANETLDVYRKVKGL